MMKRKTMGRVVPLLTAMSLLGNIALAAGTAVINENATVKIGADTADSNALSARIDASAGASVMLSPDGTYLKKGVSKDDDYMNNRLEGSLDGNHDVARVVIRGQRTDFGLNTDASQTGTAIGANAQAKKDNAVAVGNGANVHGNNSSAFGSGAVVGEDDGNGHHNNADNGLALGANSLVKGTATNSVALGVGSVADEANTVSVGSDTVKRRLTNLADGTQPSDAATYWQLTTISNQFNTSLDNLYSSVDAKLDNLDNRFDTKLTNLHNQLDNRINEVGAGAAAMAALHPLDFDPTEKLSFAVGYGNYKNANAAAIGAFYYPNPNVLVSLGTSVGEGNGMLNAGVSFKLGQGSTATSSRAALQSKVNELTKTNEALTAENQALKANDEAQDTRIAKLEQQVLALTKQLQK